MAQGQGAKGQKLGRNSRAPSNAMQRQRTEKNKRVHAEKAKALKMQQPTDVDYSYDRHFRPTKGSIITRAIKRLHNCMALWGMRISRVSY